MDDYDWDGDSRPDRNLANLVVQPGGSLVHPVREEVNAYCSHAWFELGFEFNSEEYPYIRIDQKSAYYSTTKPILQSYSSKEHTFRSYLARKTHPDFPTKGMLHIDIRCIEIDCKIFGGAYDIGGGFSHTYAIADYPYDTLTKNAFFNCWGGSGPRVTKGYRGQLNLARIICTSKAHDIRDVYDKKRTDSVDTPWGDGAGLMYGLTGVCHQMTNRILAAALFINRRTVTPIFL